MNDGVGRIDVKKAFWYGGDSEGFLGRNLQGTLRQKVKLATKLPVWEVKSAADFDKFLNMQLERLKADAVDFYLLHSLGKDSWNKINALGVLDWAEKARASGRFRWLGFSFHDNFEAFTPIIDAYDWNMYQIQYNYIDIDNQAGTKGLKYAASKNIAVVAMEPLLGGKLAGKIPEPIQKLMDGAATKRSPAAWALDWLWADADVATVLSGMSSLEQVKENSELAARAPAFSADDFARVAKMRQAYLDRSAIPCTKCGYCMPCPGDVDIPGNLNAYNQGIMYENPDSACGEYGWWKYAFEVAKAMDKDVRALNCTQCAECEPKCPQGIPISRWMPVIHQVLGENAEFVTRL